MRAFRDYVDGMCFAEGHDLILPYEQHDRRVMYKLSHKVSDMCNKRFGETATFTPEIVDALIHRLCLDKKRNETQRVKRRAGKAANSEATLGPGSALVSIIVTIHAINCTESLTLAGKTRPERLTTSPPVRRARRRISRPWVMSTESLWTPLPPHRRNSTILPSLSMMSVQSPLRSLILTLRSLSKLS